MRPLHTRASIWYVGHAARILPAPSLDHSPHQVTCLAQAGRCVPQRSGDPTLVAEAQLCCSSAAAALHLLLQSDHHHSGSSPCTRADLSDTSSRPLHMQSVGCWTVPTLFHSPHPDNTGRADSRTDTPSGRSHRHSAAVTRLMSDTHVLNAYAHVLPAAPEITNSQAYSARHHSASICLRKD